MIVSCSALYWSAYCFRCKRREAHKRGQQTLKELLQLKAMTKRHEQSFLTSVKMPPDATSDMPVPEQCWLYKASIGAELIQQFNIKYSKAMQRVCIPVYDGDALIAVVARTCLANVQPKYLTTQVPGAFFKAGSDTSRDALVLVEDVLSAIRISKYSAVAAALGTSMNKKLLLYALQFKKVLCWFDSDEAGQTARTAVSRRLRAFGIKVACITTEEDPKLHSDADIQNKLLTAWQD